jgi:hypothetical protein
MIVETANSVDSCLAVMAQPNSSIRSANATGEPPEAKSDLCRLSNLRWRFIKSNLPHHTFAFSSPARVKTSATGTEIASVLEFDPYPLGTPPLADGKPP